MSWTDSNTVKKHLLQSEVPTEQVENEEHTLWGTEPVQLRSALISAGSEEVKTIALSAPYSQGGLMLTGYNWASFDHQDLVPESVVAAFDPHRTTIYREGVDYVVDYEKGQVRRAPGSAIGDGDVVYFWCQYFTIHLKDTDYTIDYGSGLLARIEGGGIASGGIVYVDYTTTASTVPDALIEEAITEAEDKILTRLSEEYGPESTEQGLTTGATELAIAIIANAKAMDIMNRTQAPFSDDMAGQWRLISERYDAEAWRTLSPYLKKPAVRGGRTRVNLDLSQL